MADNLASASAQWDDICLVPGNDSPEFERPRIEREPFLGVKAMALIDAHDASSGACDMPEDSLNNLEARPEALQSCGDRAPYIVEAPRSDGAAFSVLDR